MHDIENLIEKFFLKKCTEAEAQTVVDFLQRRPEVLDKYLGKDEWDQEILTDQKSEIFWDEIWEKIKPEPIYKVAKRSFLRYGIAASLIAGLIGFALHYSSNQVEQKAELAAHVYQHRVIKNDTKEYKKITLEDGSTVKLNPHTQIEYDEPFQDNKRDIYLEGEAVFKVAKDKTKPFTVFSSDISTTALGTVFKVVANKNSDRIIVHLVEGKVLVKSSPMTKKNMIKNFYLLPGDVFTYNKHTGKANIADKTPAKKIEHSQLIVFEKRPLSEVFDQLATEFKVRIRYSNDDFANMYFIGSFDREDAIENILNNIIMLNNLKIEKNANDEFIIHKTP